VLALGLVLCPYPTANKKSDKKLSKKNAKSFRLGKIKFFLKESAMITAKHQEQVKNIFNSGTKYEDQLISETNVRLRLSGDLVYCISARDATNGLTTFESPARNPITEFTRSSASRLRRYLRESVAEYTTIITLTYPNGEGYNGVRAKRDLATLLKRVRRMHFEVTGLGTASWFPA